MSSRLHCRHRSTPPSTQGLFQRTNGMENSVHMAAFAELDLTTACYPKSISPWVNVVPGLRTSTAFFTFLRANLALAPSIYCQVPVTPPRGSLPPPSYINTTLKDARTHAHRRRRSKNSNRPSTPPHSTTMPEPTPSDATPPLALEVLTTRADKAAALRLIADSVSQQRAAASLHLVFHPACLALLVAGLAAAYYHGAQHDNGMLITLCAGVVMTYLLAIRFATVGYLTWAESLGWDWLRPSADGEEDTVIGTRYGDQIIGALVLRLEPATASTTSSSTAPQKRRARKDSHGSNSGTESPKLRGGKGVIRAWTTQMRYRGNGVGAGLLQEAARLTRERCGKDAEVGFALEHVHSRQVLPEFFMKPVRRIEMKAAKALEAVVREMKRR